MHRLSIISSLAIALVACSSEPAPSTGTDTDQGVDAAMTDASRSDASTTVDMGEIAPDMVVADTAVPEDAAPEPDMALPNFDETGQAGTRLRRTYVEAAGGAAMMLGMYDSELQIPCEFREAADGALRCLPTTDILNNLYFSDPTCTVPVHQVSEASCSEQWSVDPTDGKIYRATPAATAFAGDQKYERNSNGECSPTPVDEGTQYFAAELVPSIEFVEGTIDEQPRDGDLIARFIDGEDGSRLLDSAANAALGYDCTFDDQDRCVPDPEITRPDLIVYTDANCTDRIYGYSSRRAAPPSIMEVRFGDFCTTQSEYFELGAEVENVTTLYADYSGDCQERPLAGTPPSFHRLGTAIDPASIPTVVLEHEGSGPIVARRYFDQEGEPLGSVHEFYDTTTDEPCSPFETETGSAVCVPTDQATVDPMVYLDPECATPNVFGYTTCDPSTPAAMVLSDEQNCELQNVRRLIDAYTPDSQTGREYYWAAGCTARTLTPSLTGWRVGDSILDTLPSLEARIE